MVVGPGAALLTTTVKQPTYPWTGREPAPPTFGEIGRRCYVDAMYAHQMHKWETSRGNTDAADQWWAMFEGYRALCDDLTGENPEQPTGHVVIARQCATPNCDGVWEESAFVAWLRERRREPHPDWHCNNCLQGTDEPHRS